MGKSDSSVVVALSELVRMEETRMSDERAQTAAREAEIVRARERAEAEAKEAEQRRIESAAHAARVADAEARMRLEADREQARRIDAMRAELARVEAERATLRADLEARVATPSDAPRVRGWAMAFGLSSLVAASLAGLLVMNAQAPRTVIVEAPRAPVAITTPAIEVAADEVDAIETATEERVVEAAATPVASPRAGRHGHRVTAHADTTPADHAHDDLGLGTDDGSDDVLTPDILHHAERETGRH
jgi:hypothetical protein